MQDKIWTSELNKRPEVADGFDRSKTIKLYDTTLRDGEQAVGVVFNPEEKFQIASALAECGIGRIEAGFPRVSAADSQAVKRILNAGLDRELLPDATPAVCVQKHVFARSGAEFFSDGEEQVT